MEDQYGIPDLRQYITGRPLFPSIPHPPDLLSSHRGLNAPPHPYDMLVFRSDSTAANNTNAAAAASSSAAAGATFSGFDSALNSVSGGGGGGDGGNGRWPRQETLTLLEIRSRLDNKFKEANQKGPLWDEVSRIMSEEHGYQRSGKKCREKFENLYKYYKKTKEGKAGRQDGKHYRFFRQLEALYGETNTNNNSTSMSESYPTFHYNYPNNNNNNPSLSLSNYSDENTSSSDESDENNEEAKNRKRRGKKGWKGKIKDFIDAQMKKLLDKQEAWMEKMMRTIENKEQERVLREEEWRKQDALRIEREHKFWASERAWIEARDAALMEALQKITTGKEELNDDVWPECEVNKLIQLRTSVDVKFQQSGLVSEDVLWEEIGKKMACFGYDRSSIMCKEKWDSVNDYLIKCNKKRKEDSYHHHHHPHPHPHHHQGGGYTILDASSDDHINSGNHHVINNDSNCFRYFMGDAYGRIMD